ncbi:MAG: response regulator [Desulfobacterales bacterium]
MMPRFSERLRKAALFFLCVFSGAPARAADLPAFSQEMNAGVLLIGGLLLVFVTAYALRLRAKLRCVRAQNEEDSSQKAEVQEAADDARRSEPVEDTLREDFLSDVSHELRTPLIGIIGIADAMLAGAAGQISPELKKNLTVIAGCCRRLSHMVNNVADLARVKHKRIELSPRPICIQQLTDIVLTFCRPLVSEKPVKLINAIDPEIPPVHADEDRVQQILCNLVGNAIRFTDEGRVEISCRLLSADEIAVRISDTGSRHVSPEKIFSSAEPELRGTGDSPGTGISLSLTRKLVEMHGGRIWAESGAGEGTVFCFTLPVSHEMPDAELSRINESFPCAREAVLPEKVCIAKVPGQGTEKSARILVVDDDPVHLQVVVSFLAVENYEVLTAAEGNEALEFLDKEEKPDLILLDVVMPGKSGFEICRDIRKKYSPGEMPVIMLTAKNRVPDLVKGFESGANDYLSKPVSHRELISRVKTHIHLNFSDRALRESERKYREIFENVFDFWFTHDLDGNIMESNLPFKQGWGYENADVTRMNIRDMLAPRYADRFPMYMDRILHDGKYGGITCCLTREGEERMLDFRVALIRDEKERPLSVRGTARDVTERMQFEKEKAELEKQIRQSQKMQAIGTLAGGIAHDFNNILFPIIGYTEMVLERMAGDDPSRNDLEEVLRAANRAADMVRQILSFARQTEEEWKPMQIHPVIKEALKLLKTSLPATIEIRSDIPAGTDCVLADPSQIHQIVMNLCTNAYHAMRETGGVMGVSLESLFIDAKNSVPVHDMMPGPWFRLTVSDTGCGMAPEVMERIFDPYFTTRPMGEGTGMGLAVVHRIVSNLRGHITVSSTEGKGSVFQIWLPRLEPESGESEPEAAPEPAGGSERILVVDDEQQIVDMIRKMLDGMGYDVTVRYSSPDALEAFRVNPDRFDLVITDQTMPNLTGAEFCRELMKIRPDVRIILCTGFSDLISRKKAFDLGIRGFLMKPVEKKDLIRTIREVLDGKTGLENGECLE